jgi:hypothetical protein
MAIQPQVTAGGSRQRVLVLALAGVLLVVLAGVVARPLLLGGATEAPPLAAPATTAAAAPTTVTQLIGPSTSVAGQTAGTTKDPFRPVVGAGSGGTAGATTSTTVGTTTTVTTVAPAAGSADRRTVMLERVGAGRVRVSVDGTSRTVAKGGRFAGRYRVLDVGTACATFESGDALFTLCEGESVLK